MYSCPLIRSIAITPMMSFWAGYTGFSNLGVKRQLEILLPDGCSHFCAYSARSLYRYDSVLQFMVFFLFRW